MTWTRFGDSFSDRPVIAELSDAAFRLNVEGLIYCNRHQTDGRIAESQLRRLTALDAPDLAVAELEQQGVWARIEGDDAWQLDWSEQETAEEVAASKAYAAEKSRRARRHRRGDHSTCDARWCRARAKQDRLTGDATGVVTGNASGASSGNDSAIPPLPSSPLPSHPKEVGEGGGRTRCGHNKPLGVDGSGCDECVAAGDPPRPGIHPQRRTRPEEVAS